MAGNSGASPCCRRQANASSIPSLKIARDDCASASTTAFPSLSQIAATLRIWATSDPVEVCCSAAKRGNVPQLLDALRNVENINCVNKQGFTPLMMACNIDYRYAADQLDRAARAIRDGRRTVAEDAISRHLDGLERAFAATRGFSK